MNATVTRNMQEGHGDLSTSNSISASVTQQGRSGLGVEAQRDALAGFATGEGFEIVTEFVKVEPDKG